MLEVNDLHAWYGKSHVLQGVSFEVAEGEIVSLLGRKGVGRSTTVKTIMGEVEPQGSILLRNEQIAGRKQTTHFTRKRGLTAVQDDAGCN